MREGDDDETKPKEAVGALEVGLSALVEAEVVPVEKEVGAVAAIVVWLSECVKTEIFCDRDFDR